MESGRVGQFRGTERRARGRCRDPCRSALHHAAWHSIASIHGAHPIMLSDTLLIISLGHGSAAIGRMQRRRLSMQHLYSQRQVRERRVSLSASAVFVVGEADVQRCELRRREEPRC